MIQFNLLPNVKQDYIKAQRVKWTLIVVSTVVAGTVLVCLIGLILFVDVYQKTHLSSLNQQVSATSSKLNSNTNLNKILTVQNQLNTLPALESQTPKVSRIFGDLQTLTPINATISTFNADFTQNTITISGSADSLKTVNQYVDILEAAQYSVKYYQGGTKTNQPAFSAVDLSSFSYSNSNNSGQPASYTITMNFDPTLFTSTGHVTIQVPNEVATRSIQDQPNPKALFVKANGQ